MQSDNYKEEDLLVYSILQDVHGLKNTMEEDLGRNVTEEELAWMKESLAMDLSDTIVRMFLESYRSIMLQKFREYMPPDVIALYDEEGHG